MIFMTIIAGVMALASCNNGKDQKWPVNEAIEKSFNQMYPQARSVEWEMESAYYVAEFKNLGQDTEAWYDANGNWYLTVTEIEYRQLPDDIKASFKSSEWSAWKVDDCDRVERNGVETTYVLELESGNNEVHLVYTVTGELVRVSGDKQGHSTMPEATVYTMVKEVVKQKYPSARILSVEFEKGNLEVDIRDNNRKRELLFNKEGNWLMTITDVVVREVPEVVMAALNSRYPDYMIDDIERVETQESTYYLFELERGNVELHVKIDSAGNILG